MRVKGSNCRPKGIQMAKMEDSKGGDVHFLLHLSSPFPPFPYPFLIGYTFLYRSLHCPVDPGSREILWDIWDIWRYFNISIFPPIFELGRAG